VASIVGPPLLTGAFEYFTRPGARPFLPGAPYLVAAALAAGSMAIVALFARSVFRRAEETTTATAAAVTGPPAPEAG
jgi:hypothetical protein